MIQIAKSSFIVFELLLKFFNVQIRHKLFKITLHNNMLNQSEVKSYEGLT